MKTIPTPLYLYYVDRLTIRLNKFYKCFELFANTLPTNSKGVKYLYNLYVAGNKVIKLCNKIYDRHPYDVHLLQLTSNAHKDVVDIIKEAIRIYSKS